MPLVVGILVLVTGGGMLINGWTQSPQVTATDMQGHTVRLDPGTVPVPAESSQAKPNIGSRLVVRAVGLDVPLGALDAVHGEITPPGFTSAYWVRNKGVPVAEADHGTVYVVMHSLRGGGVAPGNYLTDVAHQKSKVPDGTRVVVAGVPYDVIGSRLIAKTKLAQDSSVWANTPNRLVLITCLEHADGTPSTDNLLLTAKRHPAN